MIFKAHHATLRWERLAQIGEMMEQDTPESQVIRTGARHFKAAIDEAKRARRLAGALRQAQTALWAIAQSEDEEAARSKGFTRLLGRIERALR